MYKLNSEAKKQTKVWMVILLVVVFGCTSKQENVKLNNDEVQIHNLHQKYVEGWKEMDEEKVMSLLEENSMIQPSRLTPIIGKENIRNFWFPKDSSITTINTFDTEIIDLIFRDTIAIMTHESFLDWDYRKDSTSFGMTQTGINTTIYKRQIDQSWKIWRSMWTDILAKSK